jgi:chaperonin GroES
MIKMLHDNVLILPFEAEEVTKGGIIIPDTAKEKPTKGTVISVGPGKKDEPMEVKEGDVVLYGKYGGTELTYDGKDYVRLKQNDIFCIL